MQSKTAQLETTNIFTIETITDALKTLKNKAFPILGNHPLSHLHLVRARHQTTSNSADQASLGLTLHTILLEAVDSLKPKPNTSKEAVPDGSDKSSVYYTILRERFIPYFCTKSARFNFFVQTGAVST